MPNWVTNELKVRVKDETQRQIVKSWINEDGEFDFNKIIPMPETLEMTSGSIEDEAITYYVTERLTKAPSRTKLKKYISNLFSKNWPLTVYKRLKKKISEMTDDVYAKNGEGKPDTTLDDLYKMGEAYVTNIKKYGCSTWYDWCRRFWGTKWNACDTSIEEDEESITIHFNTAWNSPDPVLAEIINKWPELEWDNDVDEEGGFFSGIIHHEANSPTIDYEDLLEERYGSDSDEEDEEDEESDIPVC